MKELSYPLAFLAGVLSFLSPCVLPLVPSYVSFITGLAFEELRDKANRRQVLIVTAKNSAVFTLGFSFVFIALGASSSLVGQLLFEYQDWIRIAGGVVVIVFGFFTADVIRLDFLQMTKKIHLTGKPAGYIGTFVVGMTFAAGWTPCIGPMLGSILLVASSQGSTVYGLKLLAVYSAGLALPFFFSALAFNTFLARMGVIGRFMRVIKITSGLLLIIFGILLLTNRVRDVAAFLPDLGIGI